MTVTNEGLTVIAVGQSDGCHRPCLPDRARAVGQKNPLCVPILAIVHEMGRGNNHILQMNTVAYIFGKFEAVW